MSREQHQRAKALFLEICDLSASERAARLDSVCGEDEGLRAQVHAMLAVDETGHGAPLDLPLEVPGGLAAGERLDGRYVVRERLGEGGLGEVWLADQLQPIQRLVAVKVVKLGMDTRQVLARFDAERQTLGILDHPNIAKVLDAGTTGAGRPYFAMEYIQGQPLTVFAREHGLGLRERLDLFLTVCDAAQYAHQKGIIHRDLTPSNVLVSDATGVAQCKVIDFGIAKAVGGRGGGSALATLEHQVIGTPSYMSPEQAAGSRDVDTRTDVYALGVLLHELLTDTTPFEAKRFASSSLLEVARILREEQPPRPSTRLEGADERGSSASRIRAEEVRGDLDWIVLKAMEKEVDRRYGTAQALAEDVRRHLDHIPIRARPPSRTYRVQKFVRRNRLLVVAGVLLLATLLVGIVSTSRARDRALTAEAEAGQREAEAIAARDAEVAARIEAEGALEEADEAVRFLSNVLGAPDPERLGQDVRVLDVLDLAEESLPRDFADRPRVEVRLRRSLGIVFRRLGMLDRAEVNLERALVLGRTAYPEGHTALLSLLGSLTSLYDDQMRFEKSEPLHREVLALRTSLNGPHDRRTLGARCNFGLFLFDQYRFGEAEGELRPTLADMREHLEPDDPFLVVCTQGLGNVLMNLGRLDEAEELFEVVRELAAAAGPSGGSMQANAIGSLAEVAYSRGHLEEALALFAESSAVRAERLPPDHWTVGQQDLRCAVILHDLGRMEEALDRLRSAYEIYVPVYGADHVVVVEVVNLAIEWHESLGDAAAVDEWRAKLPGE